MTDPIRGDTPLSKALVAEDICPKCLGELDTGWECTRCDFDALAETVENPTHTEDER